MRSSRHIVLRSTTLFTLLGIACNSWASESPEVTAIRVDTLIPGQFATVSYACNGCNKKKTTVDWYVDGKNIAEGTEWFVEYSERIRRHGRPVDVTVVVTPVGKDGAIGDSKMVTYRDQSRRHAVNTWGAALSQADGSLITWQFTLNFPANFTFGDIIYRGVPRYFTEVNTIREGVDVIYPNYKSFTAILPGGRVVPWGWFVEKDADITSQLTSGVSHIASSVSPTRGLHHITAVKDDGSAVTWGGLTEKSLPPNWSGKIIDVYSNGSALAVLKKGGGVETWISSAFNPIPNQGGDSSAVADKLRSDVKTIVPGRQAFAAIKNDGSVVTWGNAQSGGDSSAVADKLGSGVVEVVSSNNDYAFAARKSDGTVVAWGHPSYGGDASSVVGQLEKVKKVVGTRWAFAALKKDGSVVTWGYPTVGGDSSAVADLLRSGVKALYASKNTFAALKEDGTVVAWGTTPFTTSGVAAVFPSDYSIAFLKTDGSVEELGNSESAAAFAKVASSLQEGVLSIYPAERSFLAIKADGSVVTWATDWGSSDKKAPHWLAMSDYFSITNTLPPYVRVAGNVPELTAGSQVSAATH